MSQKLNLVVQLSGILLLGALTLNSQTTGNWNSSSAKTTTTAAVGIGIISPNAWEEIEYCQNTETGLIVTKDNSCNLLGGGVVTIKSNGLWDKSIQSDFIPIIDESSLKYIPISYEYIPVFSNPSRPYIGAGIVNTPVYTGGNPLIWAREKDPANANDFGTRFIVLPDGRVGINMPSPRAPLDVRVGKDINLPVAIFGMSTNLNTTKHLNMVANLGKGAYNSISQNSDFGLFYTDGASPTLDGSNNTGALVIAPWSNNSNNAGLRIDANGNVGIGTPMTNNPNGYKLGVNGLIVCKELVVDIEDKIWPDYVFKNDYDLLSIDSLKSYIYENKHLPGVKSASEMTKLNEYKVSEMQLMLLRKIEELTLYLIRLDEKNNKLEAIINQK